MTAGASVQGYLFCLGFTIGMRDEQIVWFVNPIPTPRSLDPVLYGRDYLASRAAQGSRQSKNDSQSWGFDASLNLTDVGSMHVRTKS